MAPQMISYLEALEILRSKAEELSQNLDAELLPTVAALGRVLARDIVGTEELPTFANSAMDGYAVRSAETATANPNAPLRLPILGNLAAGDSPVVSPETAGAWEIMTGAPFPPGFDACIRIEDIVVIKSADGRPTHIQIDQPAEKFLNRREVGEDFAIGASLLKAGHRLRPEDILCLVSVGLTEVSVFRKLRIGVISTGAELVSLDEKPAPGKIRNSSGPFLAAAMLLRGCEARQLGTVPDDADVFKKMLASVNAKSFDLILTTGAISMGKYDFVAGALRDLETEFYFKKVTMRPGKPILFGRLKTGPFIVGLPGNPISGAVGLRFFVDPFLRAAQQMPAEIPLRLPLARFTRKAEGSTCFFKGRLQSSEKGSRVLLHDKQQPSLMHPLLTSNVWVALPEAGEKVADGQVVDVYPMSPGGL